LCVAQARALRAVEDAAAKLPQLQLEQPGRPLGAVRRQDIAPDQLGEKPGVVQLGTAVGALLAKRDPCPALGGKQCRRTARQPAADHRHARQRLDAGGWMLESSTVSRFPHGSSSLRRLPLLAVVGRRSLPFHGCHRG